MEFSADGIDVLNRHNFYVNTSNLDYGGAYNHAALCSGVKGRTRYA